MIVVIADDLTGAAEVAGIAWQKGLKVRLCIGGQSDKTIQDVADVLVVATDTRQQNIRGAVGVTRSIVSSILSHHPADEVVFFKKTDSALRGHIVAELKAMMPLTSKRKALLLAQNPSKGRIISDGVYFIDNTPLHLTSFRNDPEYPAHTAVVERRLKGAHSLPLHKLLARGINVADAVSLQDMRKQLQKADKNTMSAGAADAFALLLESCSIEKSCSEAPVADASLPVLLFQGSTQSKPNPFDLPESLMPDAVYHGGNADAWMPDILERWQERHDLVLRIPQASGGGKRRAIHLRLVMAEVATRLLYHSPSPIHLVIEGGATAFAILQRLGWRTLRVVAEPAPGVVTLAHNASLVTLKPGSYPWGTFHPAASA